MAETRLSEVDGERGRLTIAGDDVEELAGRVAFEAVAARLWEAPAGGPLQFGPARVAAFARLPALGGALTMRDGMDALRTSVSHLSPSAEQPADTPDTPLGQAVALTGAVAVFAAAWARVRQGLPPVPPDPTLSHAADYLRMVRGETPEAARVAALDAYLVTVSDHGMNASTFAARVVASTASDDISAVVAAIGALKGPLHGGAPGPVLDMLDAIGGPENAAVWLDAELTAGRRIMGMGHRIYRVRDPRAAVLERVFERLEQAGVARGRLALARAVEQAATTILRDRHPDRPLHANVEFYTAVVLDAVGLPRWLFTPTFAVGRTVGWLAHIAEQRATGRLIRPAAHYIGARPSSF